MKILHLKGIVAAAVTFVMAMAGTVHARPVTQQEAQTAIGNWLTSGEAPLGAKFASLQAKGVTSMKGDDGRVLYHCAEISGGGFVVTSADTELTPILAFSGSGSMAQLKGSPFEALLVADQGEKLAQLAKGAAVRAVAARTRMSSSAKGVVRGNDASSAWDRLLSGNVSDKSRQSSVSDRRVDKLLETEWDQSTWSGTNTKVFNYYTPNNYVCGCTATAQSQVMKYWNAPTGNIAQFTCECEVDGRSVTKQSLSGSFDWASMPLSASTTRSPSTAQAQAIGKLTYNVGVALMTSWSSGGSGAYPNDIVSSLRELFGYESASYGSCVVGAGSVCGGDVENAIYGSLDAKMPVILAIYGTPGGHAIVADGYGYTSGTRYTHLNMGWSGFDDMWYNLMGDAIYTEACGSFTYLKGICYNIHPTVAGKVVSGQVKSLSGSVVSGATVKLFNSSGSQVASTTADSHGIYSFRVTTAGTYRVRAESGSLSSIDATVVISSSTINRWGNNLTLSASEGLPDLCFEAPIVSNRWPAAVFLSSRGSVLRQTEFETTDEICLYVGMGNAGSVKVPGVYKVTHEVLRGSEVVSSWVYEANSWDLMEPGDVTYWDGYAWPGINGLQPGSYTYRCTLDSYESVNESNESNNMVTYAFTVTGGPTVSLPVALDNSDLVFTTGGSASWFGQTQESYRNGSAAQSGVIGDSQSSWLQTTVTGPCTVDFWWKVSSEQNWDKLKFYVDDELVESISGVTSWANVSRAVGAGSHTLKWTYDKDGSASSGNDCGWVDAVTVSEPITDVTVTFDAQGGSCATVTQTYTAGEPYGWLPRPVRSGYLFSGWSGANVGTTCPDGDHTLVALWEESSITLAEALTSDDSAALTYSTGGDAPWIAHNRWTYDGTAAAYSGVIGRNQSSWVETIVTGPGRISFQWAAGSEANYDWLKFTIDGVEQEKISDAHSWAQFTATIAAGTHALRWTYSKDGSVDRGWDCGYLDDICWRPDGSSLVTVTFHGCGGTVSEETYDYDPGTAAEPRIYGYLPSASRAGYRFEGWYTAETGGNHVTEDQDVDASVAHLYAHWTYMQSLDLGTAVNAPDLTFTSGGDAPWFGQTADSQDGDGAAQSGLITHGQSSWMEATLSGSGTLAFWWKTSSESGWDKLKLYVDGTLVTDFSGTTGWECYSYPIDGEGEHTVRWTYSKDGSVSVGEDCARVDAISFSDVPPVPGPEKNGYGILVGVNEYDPSYIGSWNWLNCCVVDVNNVKSTMLLDKCGWPASNISTMLNSEATKDGIKAAMRDLAARVQPGDRVIYYHSSHGGQYSGRDTFLCTYDQDFSDTAFAEAISVFPSGVKLLIVIDACHSGGMFKSFGSSLSSAEMSQFVSGVTARLNEIRMEDHALGRKGEPKIGSGEIAWTTAADYDEYSWGGSDGSAFTETYCGAIRTGVADLTSGSIAVGNGDGKIDALEVAKYAYEYWKDENIQGYTMTPQYHNESALAAFSWVGGGDDPGPNDDKPNLRWVRPADWPAAVYLSEFPGELASCDEFEIDAPVYMSGAFQNNGKVATAAPFTILHEVIDASGDVIDSWAYDVDSLMAASSDSYSYWGGAYWDELNGLPAGSYTYRCTLDSDGSIGEEDESDNVVTFAFRVSVSGNVTITFDGNGGTPAVTTRDYTPGSLYGEFPAVSYDGYAFGGWAMEDGTPVTVNSRVPSTATTLYAQWTPTDFADLSASWIGVNSLDIGAESLRPVTLYFTVNNLGAATAAASRAAVRAAFDGGEPRVLGYVAVRELAPNGYQDCSYEISVNDLVGKATVSVTIEADADGAVEESNEGNNVSAAYSVRISESDPDWTTDEPEGDQQAFPMVFQRMSVKMPDGQNAELGDIVGAFRTDTGALCGRGAVTVDGTVTFFVRVASGVQLGFRVWDVSASADYEADADAPIVTDPGAIVPDVVIRARGQDDFSDWTLSLSLPTADWHLVSLNALPDDVSPASVFAAAGSSVDYVIGAGNEFWSPSYGGDMRSVEIGRGYWVHTTRNNVSFTVIGKGHPAKEMSLTAGWNLLGYNLHYAHAASDALATAVYENKIQFVCTTGDSSLFPYSPLTMEPGKGYWFYAERACTIAYDQVDGGKAAEVAPAAKDPLPENPWAGVPLETSQSLPTIVQTMTVTVNGQSAGKGDIVAAVSSDGRLYAIGSVDASGRVTLVFTAGAGTKLMFRYWEAGGDLSNPVILSDASRPDGGEVLFSEAGRILTGLRAEFATVSDSVTITLDYNGANHGPEVLTRSRGGIYGTLPTPTREGYVFDGWYTQKRSGTRVTASSIVPDVDTTLFAHWTEVRSYTVTVRGGDDQEPARANVRQAIPGDVVELSAPEFYWKGGHKYVFQKWVPAKTIDLGEGFKPGAYETTVSMPAQNLTITANYLREDRTAFLTAECLASRQDFDGWYVEPDVTRFQWSPDGRTWYRSGETAVVAAGSVIVQWRSLSDNWQPVVSKQRMTLLPGEERKVSAYFEFVEIVQVETAVYEGGRLTYGSQGGTAKTTPTNGRHVYGKPVGFTATPKAKYAFVGWAPKREIGASGLPAGLEIRPKFESDELNAYYMTDRTDSKIHYVAIFRPLSDYAACEGCGNAEDAFPGDISFEGAEVDSDYDHLHVNAVVGCSLNIDLMTLISPEWYPVKLRRSGSLPKGLKLDAATGIISGAPTSAGTTSFVVNVADPAGNAVGLEIVFDIEALPDGLVGQFRANLYDCKRWDSDLGEAVLGQKPLGQVELSVTSAGKVTAKVKTAATTYSFAPALHWHGEGAFSLDYYKQTVKDLTGSETGFYWFWNQENSSGSQANFWSGTWTATTDVFADGYGKIDRSDLDESFMRPHLGKYYTVALDAGASEDGYGGEFRQPVDLMAGGYVTLTVDAKGGVKYAGVFPDGEKISGSTPLLADKVENRARVCIFGVPSSYKKQGCFALDLVVGSDESISAERGGWAVPPLLTCPTDCLEALDDDDLFRPGLLSVMAEGAFYRPLGDLQRYYLSLNVDAAATPILEYSFKQDGEKTIDYVSAVSSFGYLGDVELSGEANGKVTVSTSVKPALSDGEYDYSVVNPSDLKIEFKPATGVFSGKFNLFFDYFTPKGEDEILNHKQTSVSYAGVVVNGQDEPYGVGSARYSGKFSFGYLNRSGKVTSKTYTQKTALSIFWTFE